MLMKDYSSYIWPSYLMNPIGAYLHFEMRIYEPRFIASTHVDAILVMRIISA